MIRVVLAACLSLLLLTLQHESLVHEFQHDRARLADSRVALHSASDGLCATCALIAGGSHGVTAATVSLGAPVADFVAAISPLAAVRATAAVPYSSRAPPVLA